MNYRIETWIPNIRSKTKDGQWIEKALVYHSSKEEVIKLANEICRKFVFKTRVLEQIYETSFGD